MFPQITTPKFIFKAVLSDESVWPRIRQHLDVARHEFKTGRLHIARHKNDVRVTVFPSERLFNLVYGIFVRSPGLAAFTVQPPR